VSSARALLAQHAPGSSQQQVFRFDRLTRQTLLVSSSDAGEPADGT
jgi:hypothetical protein